MGRQGEIKTSGQEKSGKDEAGAQFLRLCLQGRWHPAALQAARDLAAREGFDWAALLQAVRAGGLDLLLYAVTRGERVLPPEVEQDLRPAYFQNAKRNWILSRRLENALRSLTAEGVPVILLKGAALAGAVYGNVAVRPMSDFDLLVRQEHVPTALRVLAALGYESALHETHTGDTVAYENEALWVKPGAVETPIELHWSLFDSPYYQHALPLDWFWETALPVSMGKAATWMLGPEAQVLHLCGHLLLHHGGGEDARLLWLYDVAEVIAFYQGRMDWEQVLSRAQAYDLVLPVQRILPRVVEEWLAPVPPQVLERLCDLRPSRDEERVFARLTAAHRPVAQRFWADLASMPGWGARLRYAWRNLFPSAAYMQQRYSISHRLLVPLFYPYRWLVGLRSAVAVKASQR